jgi:hypothetical protein
MPKATFRKKRVIKKLAPGVIFESRSGEVMARIDKEIESVTKLGAKAIAVRAKGILSPHSKTGRLLNSIKAFKSKYNDLEWVVDADEDYAFHVEVGRRGVPPIPFMRQSAGSVKGWLLRLLINRLKKIGQ